MKRTVIKKIIFLLFILLNSFTCIAGTKDLILKEGALLMVAPPVVNKDYFLFELGFVVSKKFKKSDYPYNAYVNAALFEDWLDKKDRLKAGGLGFKAGVIFPTQPFIPLLFSLTTGFAKTVLHKNPFLGRDASTVSKKDMFMLEAGLLYRYDKYFLRFAYQISNVKYFDRHAFLTLGANY